MLPKNTLTKEAIANKMFRNAAQIWEYNDTDLDSFDPLVRLLIEACAVEVYNINHEIANVQERMLERLAKLLTPEVNTSAKPAHSILHVRSLEPVSNIFPSVQFFHHKKIASKLNGPLDTNLDLFFSPAGNHFMYDGDVKYIASGNNVFTNSSTRTKGVHLKLKRTLDPYIAWIGVELNHQVENLKGMTFFIDFKNLSERNSLLKVLAFTKWSLNQKPLDTVVGLWDAATNKPLSDTLYGNDEFNLTPNLELSANHFYKNHFISLASEDLTADVINKSRCKLPEELEALMEEQDLKGFDTSLCWFRVVFPANYDNSILDEMSVNINCFPVLNRHLNEVRYRLQSFFNIIPLTTEEEFFDIRTVQNISGKPYTANPIEKKDLSVKGTFALRHSGVERFDSRNATEHLNYLTELLRDESNAFAAYGQDFISTLINDLNQSISKIEQKVSQNIISSNSNSTFLFLKPFEDNEVIFVEFWTTNGEEANAIRSGTKLDVYAGTDLQRDSVVLMTNTVGGRNKIDHTELLTTYKNTLLSRGRVVTQQDIKNLCMEVLGNKLEKVEIKKGLAASPYPGEGLMQTIDIFITPVNRKTESEEWLIIERELLSKLELNSVVFSNYRVFMN